MYLPRRSHVYLFFLYKNDSGQGHISGTYSSAYDLDSDLMILCCCDEIKMKYVK